MGWFKSVTGGVFGDPGKTVSNFFSDVGEVFNDAEEFIENSTGMTVEQIAVAAVVVAVSVGTGGLATAVGAATLETVGLGAVAGVEIVGSATVGSVVGGTVIGAGVGGLSGGAQAALVGGDIGQGILQGVVVGAVGGGAGMLAAGATQGVLTIEVANGTLSANEAKAITNAVQRVTANTIGASLQGTDIATAAATGVISGVAGPLTQEYSGLGNTASQIIGGALSGAGTSAVQGGNVLSGAVGGAIGAGVAGAVGPTLEQTVRSVLQGPQATAGNVSAEVSSAPLSHQETLDIRGYLNQLAAFSQAQGLGEQEAAARQAIESMDDYYRQNEARFRDEDMRELLGLTNVSATGGNATTLTGGDTTAATGDTGGGQDVEVIGDYDTIPKGGTFTQEIVPDDTGSQYYGEDMAAGAAKSGEQQDYEAYAKQLQETARLPDALSFGGGTKGTRDADMVTLLSGGTTGGNASTGLSPFGFGGGTKSGGDSSTLFGGGTTGNGTFSTISSTSGGATSFGNGTTGAGTAGSGAGVSGGGTSTSSLQSFGQDREADKTPETKVTKKLEEPRVYTPPIYIDAGARRGATAASTSPVRSAGLDPATSGVLLSRFGNKNQVWNEATLRLADALGLL